jgi:hypothetical protein
MVKIARNMSRARNMRKVGLPVGVVQGTTVGRRLVASHTLSPIREPLKLRQYPLARVNCLEVEALPVGLPDSHDEKLIKCCCIKTKCLKMYCECFSNELFCGPHCGCTECSNSKTHQGERNEALEEIVKRNPDAFTQKKAEDVEERAKLRGCNCKKSGCNKKYCECLKARVKCTLSCKCSACKNREQVEMKLQEEDEPVNV